MDILSACTCRAAIIAMPDSLGKNVKLIGRYSVLRELRRDRYTVAYLAFDPVLNRELVLKAVQLQPRAGHDAAGHERIEQAFMRQAQAAGRLHHPHIVTVFDAGRFRDIGYLALERVDGKLLDEAMAEGYQPGFLQVADIAARVADAVEYAHARGVPHGHLAPSRIYLQGAERTPRVMGFGGWIDSGTTGDFELAGTQSMLPYFQNELSPDARRKDVRALGALLFLLLTGTRPDNALRSHKAGDSPILDLRPTAPVELAEIAENALGLSGGRPFGTAAQFRNALTTYLWGNRGVQGLPSAATITGMPASMAVLPGKSAATIRAPRPIPAAPTRRSRSNIVAIGAAACALALIGAFAVASRNATVAPPPLAAARAPTPAVAPAQPAPTAGDPFPSAIEASGARLESKVESDPQAQRSAAPVAQRPARTTIAPAPARGVIAFAVAPWGEVYVNGAAQGTTPPLTQLLLPAGRHTIELRNGQRPPYVAQVDVSPDRPQRISHRFQ